MTIIRQGGGNKLTGMVGGIVIAERNGKQYYRRAPQREVKNSWTPAQLLHRQRFSKVNEFCNLFKHSLIPQIWNAATFSKVQNFGKVGITNIMSGYALFLKTNMPAFAPDGSLEDAKKLQLSIGKLSFPPDLLAMRLASDHGSIEVNWTLEPHILGQRLSDELMVISAAHSLYSEITATGIKRGDLTGTFVLPPLPLPETHIYLLFASKDRRDYSPSRCFIL